MDDMFWESVFNRLVERSRNSLLHDLRWSRNVKVLGDVLDESGLQELGRGSARAVFRLSSRFALKAAINEKGIAQNKSEAKIAEDSRASVVVAAVHEVGPMNLWLITQMVRPLSMDFPNEEAGIEEFEKLTGMSWNDLLDALKSAYGKAVDPGCYRGCHRPQMSTKQFIASLSSASRSWVRSLIRASIMYELEPYEVMQQLGKTSDGRVVIYDYGATRSVVLRHYR